MFQLNLFQIEEKQKAIHLAIENGQHCPLCGSGFKLVGANKTGEVYVHDCDCWFDLALTKDSLTPDTFIADEIFDPEESLSQEAPPVPQISTYKENYLNFCHNCKQPGVDSSDSRCVEDPPYKYRCRFCHHSLRTHPLFGEKKDFDMANLNKTWGYLNGQRVIFQNLFPKQL